MEELIEILITIIARWLQGGAPKRTQRNVTPPSFQVAPPAAPAILPRAVPSNRAVVTTRMPSARKAPARRAKLPAVAMSRPIVTSSAPAPVAPLTPPIKAVAAKPLAPASKTTKVPLTAAPIRRWLNPTTLQQQFVLTEIFQPPLALRETRQW